MMTWFSEKIMISYIYICGFMPNSHKKWYPMRAFKRIWIKKDILIADSSGGLFFFLEITYCTCKYVGSFCLWILPFFGILRVQKVCPRENLLQKFEI